MIFATDYWMLSLWLGGSLQTQNDGDVADDENAPDKRRVLNFEIQCKLPALMHSNIHVMILIQISSTRWTQKWNVVSIT